MDISKIKISGTDYTLKDAVARGEETETEGISHIEIGGVSYDCKDIVARGEGEATENEISKVSIGGKTYQVKDETARANKVYFVVWCEDDGSCTFYGDTEKPAVGSQYKGKTVTEVGDFENTPVDDYPDFNTNYFDKITTVYADPSASGARPQSCYGWFEDCTRLANADFSNLNTSNVTSMYHMFYNCFSLTTIYSDDDVFVTTKVTSSAYMFTSCSELVGGNGTAYDSSRVDHTMAHIDTEDNPGYFTAKD